MLRHKTLQDTVLLIYANKVDYEDSMSVREIVEGLEVLEVIGERRWHVQRTCAISGQGLKEGLEWLCKALQAKNSTPPPPPPQEDLEEQKLPARQ
jgi:hypothetical protein